MFLFFFFFFFLLYTPPPSPSPTRKSLILKDLTKINVQKNRNRLNNEHEGPYQTCPNFSLILKDLENGHVLA